LSRHRALLGIVVTIMPTRAMPCPRCLCLQITGIQFLESRELGGKPLGIERFAQRLVFWRTTDGQPHVHPDRCPHLGAALSRAKICADRLTCPFHGIAFDAEVSAFTFRR